MIYLWTQQDRSRTPSTLIWSRRYDKVAQESTFQRALPTCLLIRLHERHLDYQKNPDLPGRDFSNHSFKPCYERPKSLRVQLSLAALTRNRGRNEQKTRFVDRGRRRERRSRGDLPQIGSTRRSHWTSFHLEKNSTSTR